MTELMRSHTYPSDFPQLRYNSEGKLLMIPSANDKSAVNFEPEFGTEKRAIVITSNSALAAKFAPDTWFK